MRGPLDTEADGMPNAWDRSRQFAPNAPEAQAADSDNDGYTNLGAYLNEPATHVAIRHLHISRAF